MDLKKILADHEKWIRSNGEKGKRANLFSTDLRYADLRSANLSAANLNFADLNNANLDFSCFPLYCGGLDVHIDDKQATQLLYHLIRNVQYSKNTSKEMKDLLGTKELIQQANKFHRVDECGKLKFKE